MQWLIGIIYEMVMAHWTGMILMWSGAVVDIPAGWHLCDGTNGTPDLRNRFIVGAGDTYAPGATGGASSHNHTFSGTPHTHTFTGDSHQHDLINLDHDHTFTGDGHYHDPSDYDYPEMGYGREYWAADVPSTTDPATGTTDGDNIAGALANWAAAAGTTDSRTAEGTINTKDHRPPYYALCYIMKL